LGLNFEFACFQAILVIFVYFMISHSYDIVREYVTDLDYSNAFLMPYIRRIDKRRAERGSPYPPQPNLHSPDAGETHIFPLRAAEMHEFKLHQPWGWPSVEEKSLMMSAFYRWLVVFVLIHVILLHDWFIHNIIDQLADATGTQVLTSIGTIDSSLRGELVDA
jgi:hypothetical protein